jgi:agmatine deiminase
MSYHFPAEWEPHSRVWLAWPHAKADWPGKFAPVPWIFAEMIRAITRHGKCGLLVKDAKAEADAKMTLERAGVDLQKVALHIIPTNRGWLRDCGPIWVRDGAGKKQMLDWGFTAWAKYPNWRKDNAVPEAIAALTGDPRIVPTYRNKPVVLEGGGIETDGEGTLIVTEEWLLSDTQIRNKKFTREDYERVFSEWLGIEKTLWLGHGIVGDDTHGHVDDITRFTAPGVALTVVEHHKSDPNYALLQENVKRLERARDAKGRQLAVVELPMPEPILFEGQRLPASYANYLVTNGVVIVPIFGDVYDRVALDVLAQAFPTREIIPLYARDLVWGLGTVHCLTQQEPV